jgi:two-component system OmpR family sensor kinase
MPIRIRLALSFAAVTLVLVAVGGLLFARSFRNGLESSLEPGLRAQANTLTQSLRGESNAGQAILRSRDVVAQVLDPAGHVIDGTREAGPRPVVSSSVIRDAHRARVFVNVTVHKEHEPYRVFATPVSTADGKRIVVVATSLEPTNEAAHRVHDALLVGGTIAVLLAGVGGWLLARAALRPVERMRREAAEISTRDTSSRLPVPSTRDEIAAVATTMNALLADLQGALSRQRSFVADAGHELRTPLAVLRAELELAGRPQRTPEELRDAIAHATEETDRLARIAEQLLFLAHRDDGGDAHFETGAVGSVLERAISNADHRVDHGDVRVKMEAAPEIRARFDPDLLRRAVDNLLENSLRYSPPGGMVTVKLEKKNGRVVIEVRDQGPGFPPEFLPHAFERFRRADDARIRADGGTGLGLAIVLAVARAHAGTTEAANHPDGGAVVIMRIPGER